MHFAALSGSKEIVEYLIELGIDINEKTNEGKNALHIVFNNVNIEITKYLIEKGIDISEKTNVGKRLVDYLIELVIDINDILSIDHAFINNLLTRCFFND